MAGAAGALPPRGALGAFGPGPLGGPQGAAAAAAAAAALAQPDAADEDLLQVLRAEIPWETYMTARLIADKDLQLIRRFDKRAPELQASLLDESGPAYVEAFLTVLRNVTKEETVQYILALLLQVLAANPGRALLFHQAGEAAHGPGGADPYTIFLRLLQRSDWFTQEKACRLLTQVVRQRPVRGAFAALAAGGGPGSAAAAAAGAGAPPDPAEQAVTSFVDWLCGQLRRPSHPVKAVPTAVAALAVLLREKPARALFTQAGGVALLAPLLRTCTGPTSSQLAYEVCLCLWQLSYYRPALAAMASAGVAKGLAEVVRLAQKEKVVRVALLCLRNLLSPAAAAAASASSSSGLAAAAPPPLEAALSGVASDLVEAGLPKVVATRALQSWGDEDIPEALEALSEALRDQAVAVSSWERYRKEVLSGALDWSPMHTSEAFWRANAAQLEERDFQLLRVLLKLLETSRDARTLAVAANDVGRFVEFHPHGRYIVSDLRGKELAMRLMSHPDADVQKRALLAVQKLLLPPDKLGFLQQQQQQQQQQQAGGGGGAAPAAASTSAA